MRLNSERLRRQQGQLDEVLHQIRPWADVPRPRSGWLKAIREGLGMTSAQLARRLGVTQPTVLRLEQSEKKKSISLASLERAAEALGCRLVYALVPDTTLEETVAQQALKSARRRVARVHHTMALEDQATDADTDAKLVRERASGLASAMSSSIWDEP